ncbi:MAG: hypothetical protein LBR75_02565 [Prevotellaceae bacterium]|jgi:hypothetical protein|nr:hypothetical protein [Prevotellaceae bacterium]
MMNFCEIFSGINWCWYAVAIVVVFAVGGLWFSVFFKKTWVRVFKVEMPEKRSTANMVRTMGMQFLINAVFGLWFFILTQYGGFWFAVITLCVFCAWQKGLLNFHYPKFKDYAMAAIIEAGFTFITGMVFILFALI